MVEEQEVKIEIRKKYLHHLKDGILINIVFIIYFMLIFVFPQLFAILGFCALPILLLWIVFNAIFLWLLTSTSEDTRKEYKKEKKLRQIENIKNHIVEQEDKGLQKMSISKYANEIKMEPLEVMNIIRQLKQKGHIIGEIDDDNWMLKFKREKSKNNCPNCRKIIKPDWKICPYCQTDLE